MNVILQGLLDRPTVTIAHRGARSLAPENTLAAAKIALDTGADMWEADLRLTADGHVVVTHDETLGRTSNARLVYPSRGPWRVSDFTLDELRGLDFGSWYQETDPYGQIAAGAVGEKDLMEYRGQTALTLEDALTFTRESGMGVNLEIKGLSGTGGHTLIVRRVVRVVEEMAMSDRVIISSFEHDYLRKAKRLNPDIATGVLVHAPRRDPEALLESLGADAYHPRVGTITRKGVRKLQGKGFPVLIWVVNDPKIMVRLIEVRVSGIFTDFPQTLAPLLGSVPSRQALRLLPARPEE